MAQGIIKYKYFIKIAWISFRNKNGGKSRPVLVHFSNQYVNIWKITSKYLNKSKYIKQQYFPIFKWHPYGLNKTSYVDIRNKIRLPYQIYLNTNLCRQEPVWSLDYSDVMSFIEFCDTYQLRIKKLKFLK